MQDRRISQSSTVCFLVAAAATTVFLGWLLSSARRLTHGALPALLLLLLLSVALRRNRDSWTHSGLERLVARLRARWRRPLPLMFYLSVLLSLVGGLTYAPNNYDALSYRIPRLLAWLSNHGWYWIATSNQRMDYSGPVQEWLFAPLLEAFQSERLLFIINIVFYALMPYLIF